ncbi:hypothetical protein N9383_04425 [Granulosicoccus sp.]|nr:hypothetical protein [Granulosicoccus sp.]
MDPERDFSNTAVYVVGAASRALYDLNSISDAVIVAEPITLAIDEVFSSMLTLSSKILFDACALSPAVC